MIFNGKNVSGRRAPERSEKDQMRRLIFWWVRVWGRMGGSSPGGHTACAASAGRSPYGTGTGSEKTGTGGFCRSGALSGDMETRFSSDQPHPSQASLP